MIDSLRYMIVLVVLLKTIKTSAFLVSVRFVPLYAEVLNTAIANPCGTPLFAVHLLIQSSNPLMTLVKDA